MRKHTSRLQLFRSWDRRFKVMSWAYGDVREYGIKRPLTKSTVRRLQKLTYAPNIKTTAVLTMNGEADLFIARR